MRPPSTRDELAVPSDGDTASRRILMEFGVHCVIHRPAVRPDEVYRYTWELCLQFLHFLLTKQKELDCGIASVLGVRESTITSEALKESLSVDDLTTARRRGRELQHILEVRDDADRGGICATLGGRTWLY